MKKKIHLVSSPLTVFQRKLKHIDSLWLAMQCDKWLNLLYYPSFCRRSNEMWPREMPAWPSEKNANFDQFRDIDGKRKDDGVRFVVR